MWEKDLNNFNAKKFIILNAVCLDQGGLIECCCEKPSKKWDWLPNPDYRFDLNSWHYKTDDFVFSLLCVLSCTEPTPNWSISWNFVGNDSSFDHGNRLGVFPVQQALGSLVA